MKVVLLAPPFAEIYGNYRGLYRRGFLNPPLSLCYLAAALEQRGHKVQIIDAEAEALSTSALVARIQTAQPQLVGVTATSVDFAMAAKAIAALKQALPSTPLVLGGTHINIFRQEVLENQKELDFGCVGDGEDFIVELAQALSSSSGPALSSIQGLIYRAGGKVVCNPDRAPEPHIDRYAFPARQHLRNALYRRSAPRVGMTTATAFMSSRGCPYSCIYCAVKKIYGGCLVRLRSAANVLAELDVVVKQLGITHVSFNDDCLTLNKDRMYELCQGIQSRGLKFTWEGLSRADLVDLPLLKAMKEAGMVRISYGIESGNPKILRILEKNETLDEIRAAFRLTREAGIMTRGSVIIGNPYETRQTVEDTFRFIEGLEGLDQVIINVLQPYPGTKVRDMILAGEGGSSFSSNPNSYEQLHRFGSSAVKVNDLTPADLVRLQRKGFRRFYLRPGVLWRNLRLNGLKPFVQDGVQFCRSLWGW
ncbi:MAG: radical SAM protein [Planctomycetota bacterium]